jgi:hypothetical protein
MIKPVTMVAESLRCLRALFAGEEARRADFPNLTSYSHLKWEVIFLCSKWKRSALTATTATQN